MTSQIVVVGLGATGRAMASSLMQRTDVEIVGAADKDPRSVGQDLGVLLGGPVTGVAVVSDPAELPPADLAVVATTSDLNQVADTLLPLLERSYNILSICEELAYPWRSHPQLARRLDETAKANAVTVLGSGANPGILMDTLPPTPDRADPARGDRPDPQAHEHVALRSDPVQVRARPHKRRVRGSSQARRGRRPLPSFARRDRSARHRSGVGPRLHRSRRRQRCGRDPVRAHRRPRADRAGSDLSGHPRGPRNPRRPGCHRP